MFPALDHSAAPTMRPTSPRATAGLPLALAFVCVTGTIRAQEPNLPEALRTWFATPDTKRGAPPADAGALGRADAERLLPALVAAWRDGGQRLGLDTLPALHLDDPAKELEASALQIGDVTMPFVLLHKGTKPPSGWPLFLCLHGGGGNAEATGPHAWAVNTREWHAQKALFARVYKAPGLYFIPRMADDRSGRWWFTHNQQAFAQVIAQAIRFRDVDPDRVYLMGISEGGYGAIRFAGNRPDRFAGCGGMAAAEPLSTSPPANMRNVAFRIDIGENDTMYDRVGLARRMGEALAARKAEDPSGYDFVVHVQKGRGHGIDYSLTPAWLAERVRNPRPDRVEWTVVPFDTEVALQQHWLALEAAPPTMPLQLSATLRQNRLALDAWRSGDGGTRVPATDGAVLVRLDDRLADLDQPIVLVVNGRERPPLRAARSLATMARTLAERDDPQLCFCTELRVSLGD